ncbi:MAG: flagellar filament capping protein FliD [Spirochaetales bacterium]|nr:flagellar filament capping protein FliD [Spirochaetales bacterium]
MSDFSIPGVSDKYGTQKMIAGLMKVKKFKLTEMENANKKYESDKVIWKNLNRRMKTVQDDAQALYGFNSPFGAKLGSSSDDSILTVQASRRSVDGSYKVKVIQLAAGDSFLSKSLPLDYHVPDGDYVFKVGKKTIPVSFHGAKLTDFVSQINSKGDGALKAIVVKDTETTQVLQIQTVGVGTKNKLNFDPAAQSLMEQMGVIGPAASNDVPLVSSNTDVGPQTRKSWQIPSGLSSSAQLEIRYSVSQNSVSPAPPPEGFSFPPAGSVNFRGLKVQNTPMKGELPPVQAPPPPVTVNDPQVFSLQGGSQNLDLSPIQDNGGTITLPVSSFPPGTQSLVLDNKNTGKTITVVSAKISDPNTRGNWKPLDPVSQAQDAVLDYEGVHVVRDSNTLSDVVPGTTINLVSPSDKTVQIKVQPDRKTIKDQVVNFLIEYNKLLTDINVLTSMKSDDPANASVIADALYYDDKDKKAAEKELGRYQGDLSLNTMKSMLQRAMMDPYGIPGQTRYTLLAQVGISTNANSTESSGPIDVTKLRGYLEFNETKFDAALEKDPQSVRDLFGVATHGDFIVDNGAAFRVYQIINPYTTLGGLNDSKVASIDTSIKNKDREIRDYKDSMASYEQDLKVKFGNMESTLDMMKKNSDQLNNIGR